MAKNYEDFLRDIQAQQEEFSNEESLGITPNSPLNYTLNKISGEQSSEPSLADSNSLYDFVGNALWGGAESFLLPTVADIAAGGTISEKFGSQDWKDESLAGKAGYITGTGLGMLTGIGLVGKGLGTISKIGGAGTKAAINKASKELSEAGVEGVSDDVIGKLVNNTRSNITDAVKESKKTLKFSDRLNPFSTNKKLLTYNPLSNPIISGNVFSRVSKEVAEELGEDVGSDVVKQIANSVMDISQKSMHKNFGHSITHQLISRGTNAKMAQRIGDAAYEAALLGVWDTVIGEAADAYADSLGLSEEEWGFDNWYHRSMHGIAVGGVLSQMRYIKGGKQVQIGQTGIIGDALTATRFMVNRFLPVKKVSDKALVGFLNSVQTSAGNASAFAGHLTTAELKAISKRSMGGTGKTSVVSASDREKLELAYNAIKKDLPRLSKELMKEIGRDGIESFWRMTAGSFAMNASGYKQAYDEGFIFTEDYPWDKVVADHMVGMFYMKRGKTFKGEAKMPVYYSGKEISNFKRSFDIMGRNPEGLDIYNTWASLNPEQQANALINFAGQSSNKTKEILDIVRGELVEVKELSNIIQEGGFDSKGNSNYSTWQVHSKNALNKLIEAQSKATKDGNTEKAASIGNKIRDLQNKMAVVEFVEMEAMLTMTGSTVRPMEYNQAMEYIDRINNSTLPNGKKINSNNLDIFKESIDSNRRAMQDVMESVGADYIQRSLRELGVVSEADVASGQKLVIHNSVVNALKELSAQIVNVEGKNTKPYFELADTLVNAIQNAARAETITLSDSKGIRFNQTRISNRSIKELTSIYKDKTNEFHDLIYNTIAPEANWQMHIPGYKEGDGRFVDEQILGNDAIWHAIQTGNRIRRLDTAYKSFRKKDSLVNEELSRLLDGNNAFKIVEKKDGVETEIKITDPELQVFASHLGATLDLFNTSGSRNYKKITESQLLNIKELMRQEFGNMFEKVEEFEPFVRYVDRKYIQELAGGADLSLGLKQVIRMSLDPENLVAVRLGKKIQFRSAAALEKILLKESKGATVDAETQALIDQYRNEIEIPLQKALQGRSSLFSFNDNLLLDTNISGRDVASLKQSIREMINKNSVHDLFDMGRLSGSIHELSNNLKLKLEASSSISDGKINKELIKELQLFATDVEKMQSYFTVLSENNDVIGLRHLIDSRNDLVQLNRKIQSDLKTDTQTIKDYRRILNDYLEGAIIKQRRSLGLEDISDLNNLIETQLEHVNITDRAGRPKSSITSLSIQQYESKWGLGNDFAINLVENPRKVFQALDAYNAIGAKNVIFNDLFSNGLSSILSKTHTEAQYVDVVLKPLIKAYEGKIKNLKNPPGTIEDFKLDTYFVVQQALSSRKMPIGMYENGTLKLSESNLSSWNVGINKLSSDLGLLNPHSMILLSQRVGTKNGYTTNLRKSLVDQIFIDLRAGSFLDINTKDILTSGDKAQLEKYSPLLAGRGKDGKMQFTPVQLDEKTVILIPQSSYKDVINTWENSGSKIRKDLLAVLKSNGLTEVDANLKINEYLKSELNASIDATTNGVTIKPTTKNIETLTLLTRLLGSWSDDVFKVMNGTMPMKNALSSLKYLKLDSPRNGIALNERTLNFAKAYIGKLIDGNMKNPYNTMKTQFFNADGTLKKHRTLNIFDESGDINKVFDSKTIAKKILDKQLETDYGKSIGKTEKAEMLDKLVEQVESASVMNGEKYLSLPEMTAMLMAKGAKRDWFQWNEAGEVIGFNVAIKPIELYSNINQKTGEIIVHAGKTAYKYNPLIDKLMKDANGNYFLDSVGFESTHKKHTKYDPITGEWTKPGVSLPTMGQETLYMEKGLNFNNVKDSKGRGTTIADQAFEIDRSGIFIKSISAEKDATQSFGWGNYLSTEAQAALNQVTGVPQTISDMTNTFNNLASNPFAYKKVADKLLNFQLETGDMIGRVTGVESVLQAGGLPIYEFMRPSIEKMVVSEFMGTRNMISSSIKNGSYSVMTSGDGYSMPVRIDGIQRNFGGSGVSAYEGNKLISPILKGELPGESMSLIFKATGKHAKKGFIREGNDILVSFQNGKAMISSPHLRADRNSKQYKAFEADMSKAYKEIIDILKSNSGIKTLADAVDYLQNVSRNSDLYKSVHIGKVDLRTPKAGLNDWVITRIEKVLDPSRGPVSEMNLMDVINPQDADFDLDKSASMFSLPGRVTRELYQVSGYHTNPNAVFDQAMQSIKMTENADMVDYATGLKAAERKRAGIIRQQGVLSTLLQFLGSADSNFMGFNFKAGKENTLLFDYKTKNNQEYKIRLKSKDGLVDSIANMKSLIKATIDIYKEKQNISDRDLVNLLWFDSKNGILEVVDKNNKTIPTRGYNPEVKQFLDTFVKDILNPIGELHNLALMTDNVDGVSRKMSPFELTHKYEKLIGQIHFAGKTKTEKGFYIDNALSPFTTKLTEFLGRTSSKGSQSGMSESPLIKALSNLSSMTKKEFSSIPYNEGIGEILMGKVSVDKGLTGAIAGIMKDQKTMAQIRSVSFRLEQIDSILENLRYSNRTNTDTYKYWEKELEIHRKLIDEYNTQINDPKAFYEGFKGRAIKKPTKRFLNNDIAIFRKKGEKYSRIDVKEGEFATLRKGDVVIDNPKTIVAQNEMTAKIRRSMHNAFARKEPSLTMDDVSMVNRQYNSFRESIRESSLIDPSAPKTSNRFGLLMEERLTKLADHLAMVRNINPIKADALERQFLFRMLVPRVSETTFDYIGYKNKQRVLTPHFLSNKMNERLVFQYLGRVMEGKGQNVMSTGTGTQIFKELNERFLKAFMKEHDATLEGNVFNFERLNRAPGDFSLFPPSKQLPRFVYETNINQKSKDIMMGYLNGSYFLDPAELYRMTMGLRSNPNSELPTSKQINAQMRYLWEGSEGLPGNGDAWYRPTHSFRDKTYHNKQRAAKNNLLEGLREQFNKCFGG